MTRGITLAAVLVALMGIPTTVATSRQAWASDAPAAPAPAPAESKPAPAPAASPTTPVPAVPEQATGQAAPASAEIPEVVMARVGDRKITVEQFMKYVTQGGTPLVLKARTVPGKTEILREIILDRLMEEGMLREDLLPKDRKPTAKDYSQAYQQLASRHFPKSTVTPSEEELYQYYEQHPELFGIPAMVRISQIQFRTPENADEKTKAEVKAKAEDALKRLHAGESFSTLAETLTENPLGKVTKGDLGFLQPEKDRWLRKAVEGLPVGQFSTVLESPVGYEIILVQDKRDAMITPYVNVRDKVLERIRQEAQVKAREEYAWKLANEVGVSVEMPELKDAVLQTKAEEPKAASAEPPKAAAPATEPPKATSAEPPKAAAPAAEPPKATSAEPPKATSAEPPKATSAEPPKAEASAAEPAATPEQLQTALKERVDRYWAARQAKDVRTLYDLESAARPGGWLKLENAMSLLGLPVRKVKVEDVRVEGDKGITRISAEVMIGTIGWRPSTIEDPWMLVDGQWYHETYRNR